MAKSNTKAVTENDGPKFGQTGYGITISEEGQSDINGNFITDEDLKEYQELKAAKQSGQFISNEDAEEMKSLQEQNHNLKKQVNFTNERMTEVDKTYSLLKEQVDAGLLLTNDEADHYQSLKEKVQKETAELEAKQAADVKAEENRKQAAIAKLGPNPVYAKNVDGERQTVFTRTAWDGLAWETKDGQQTNIKAGGWVEKSEVPPEVANLNQ